MDEKNHNFLLKKDFFLQNYKVIEKDLRERQKRQEKQGKDKDKGPQDMYIGKGHAFTML